MPAHNARGSSLAGWICCQPSTSAADRQAVPRLGCGSGRSVLRHTGPSRAGPPDRHGRKTPRCPARLRKREGGSDMREATGYELLLPRSLHAFLWRDQWAQVV
jgi:hypothetical protein